jgi:hypothetical protein
VVVGMVAPPHTGPWGANEPQVFPGVPQRFDPGYGLEVSFSARYRSNR